MFLFHHVSISVKDLYLSIRFYECFGFRPIFIKDDNPSEAKMAHLALGEMMLELFSYPSQQPAPDSTKSLETDLPTIGIKHFALKVESIDKAYAFLLQKNWVSSEKILNGKSGIRYFFIKDPNGIFLEIVEDNRTFS